MNEHIAALEPARSVTTLRSCTKQARRRRWPSAASASATTTEPWRSALDLEVPAGEFFGLLGPNGAGKTTLINAVCNLIRLTAGEISVFGHPGSSLEARRLVGVAEQEPNLDRFLTVREALLYHGGYFGMDRARRRGAPRR